VQSPLRAWVGGFLDQFEEDAVGRPRVHEGDKPTVGARPRFCTDQRKALLLKATHLGANVPHREGKMVQTFATAFDETRDDSVRSQRFEEFDRDRTRPKEGHANALTEDLLDRFGLEAESPIVRQRRIEMSDRYADMMSRTDHTSCLGR